VREPPNDRRNFVHKKLLGFALPAVASFIPGGSTVLGVARSFTGGGGTAVATRPAPLRNLGLTDERRRAITAAGQAAQARGDHKEAAAFMRELGAQGPLMGPATAIAVARPSVLRDLGLTDDRRRAITRAMRAATARGDAKEASAFLRELGSQGALLPVDRKPLPDVVNLHPRPRARIPFIEPVRTPHPIGAIPMPVHRRIGRAFRDTFNPATALTGPECPPGAFRGPGGVCIDPSAALPFGDPLFGAGSPEMGRYGPAYRGTSRLIQRTTCLPGDLVGNDGLCYNRKSLTNSQRQWPKGRAPLLTGGQMNAIRIAAAASAKLERTTKRLQKIGLMKKAAPRRAAPKLPAHQHQITSGG